MKAERVHEILRRFPALKILVLGDFFLDQYLMLDRDLSERSVETGLEAYQVTKIRNSPGAAGTVCNNLRALDLSVIALGAIGKDGRGFDLMEALGARGVDTRLMIESDRIMTPTYTKPMLSGTNEPVHELERLDIKNRKPLPAEIEASILANIEAILPEIDGILITDQVQEDGCGVMTERVRRKVAEIGGRHPEKSILVDSRLRTGQYEQVILKCNLSEALKTTGTETVEAAAAAFSRRNVRGSFITLGCGGIYVTQNGPGSIAPGIPVSGPIDICGAGDSAASGILSALCAGASWLEAAEIGNRVASITIRQLGTTGTASREEVAAVNATSE